MASVAINWKIVNSFARESGILRYFIKYIMVVITGALMGGIVGSMIGAITFKSYSAVYTLLFGAEQGLGFGVISGYVWSILFGWLVLRCGYLDSGIIAVIFVFAFSLFPALMGNAFLAWWAGILGSIISVPVILLRSYINTNVEKRE